MKAGKYAVPMYHTTSREERDVLTRKEGRECDGTREGKDRTEIAEKNENHAPWLLQLL